MTRGTAVLALRPSNRDTATRQRSLETRVPQPESNMIDHRLDDGGVPFFEQRSRHEQQRIREEISGGRRMLRELERRDNDHESLAAEIRQLERPATLGRTQEAVREPATDVPYALQERQIQRRAELWELGRQAMETLQEIYWRSIPGKTVTERAAYIITQQFLVLTVWFWFINLIVGCKCDTAASEDQSSGWIIPV